MRAGYKEGPESLFTHEGLVYRVDDLLKLTKNLPVQDFPLERLVWMVDESATNKARVKAADLKYPVIVTEYAKDKFVTLDGFHRVTKAAEAGQTEIKAILVDQSVIKRLPVLGNTVNS